MRAISIKIIYIHEKIDEEEFAFPPSIVCMPQLTMLLLVAVHLQEMVC